MPEADFPQEEESLSRRDPELVERAKEGDRCAFVALFKAHANYVYSVSLRLAGDITAAEDLTRDIFVLAFSTLDAIRDDAEFAKQLHRSAVKTLIARQRQAARNHPTQVKLRCKRPEDKDVPMGLLARLCGLLSGTRNSAGRGTRNRA